MLAAHSLSKDELRALTGLPFFARIREEELARILASVRRRSYRRGEVIHHVDDVAGDFFVILKGYVKHRLTAPDGRQLTHSMQSDGSFFGLMSVIDGQRRAGDAVAMTDCDLLVIDRDVMAGHLERHPEAAAYLLRMQTRQLRRCLSQIQDLAFLSVPKRLAKVLLEFSERDPATGELVLPPHVNQTELAFLVGTSRESINQWLKHFMRQGWVSFDRRGVRLTSRQGLESFAG